MAITQWILHLTLICIMSAEPSKTLTKEVVFSGVEAAVQDSSQLKAYQILVNKCNVCHRKQNKRRVFTQQNMVSWAKDIEKQVFIKKRMPRGRKITLSTQEYQTLKTWINTLKQQ